MKFFLRMLGKMILVINKISSIIWCKLQASMMAECGKNVVIEQGCRFIYDHVHIGSNVFIGYNASFLAAVSHIYIGNHVMFGPNVTIRGGNHRTDIVGEYMIKVKEKLPENDADVIIEDDVWIGCNVTILKGVRIGKGSIIGACSLIVKDIPPYTIYVGSPAKKEWKRWDHETVTEHEKILMEKYKF